MEIYIYNMNILVNIYKCDRDIQSNWLKFYALKKSLHTSSLCWFQPKVFAMPEAAMWFFFPDAGASNFLSRLPGYFGNSLHLYTQIQI